MICESDFDTCPFVKANYVVTQRGSKKLSTNKSLEVFVIVLPPAQSYPYHYLKRTLS